MSFPDDQAESSLCRWDPVRRLTHIALQCVSDGSASSVEDALCSLYETSLVLSWWDEILFTISSWMGRCRTFDLSGDRSCSALAVSPEDLLLCAGICANDVFEVGFQDRSLVFTSTRTQVVVSRIFP